jgi:hypothetical protein
MFLVIQKQMNATEHRIVLRVAKLNVYDTAWRDLRGQKAKRIARSGLHIELGKGIPVDSRKGKKPMAVTGEQVQGWLAANWAAWR